jgi:hypothetical protein
MPVTKTVNAFCPKCRSKQIVEIGTVNVDWEVISWNSDGTPKEYGERREFDTNIGSPRFLCKDCKHEFDNPVMDNTDEMVYIYTTGAFIAPIQIEDGSWIWAITSFDGDSFQDGDLIIAEESAQTRSGLFKKPED